MLGHVEIFLIDDEGIFIRAYSEELLYFYNGDPEDDESPLTAALRHYYMENAPKTILCQGYETPCGILIWESEWATPFSDEEVVEIGERLFLVDEMGNRFMDDYIYQYLADGKIPPEWYEIKHDHQS